jgi:hypothetical protein
MGSTQFAGLMRNAANERILPALIRDDAKQYLEASERDAEAALVEPLAVAFTRYEVYPPAHGKGLGRYSPVSLIPPVGSLLRKKVADPETALGIEQAVMRTLAVGYCMLASTAPQGEEKGMNPAVVEGRDLEAMWAFWVTNSHSGYAGKIMAPDFSDAVTTISEAEFLTDLDEADAMPKLGKRTKLHLLARAYGEAGVLLRHVQTGTLSDGRLHGDVVAQVTMNWPLHAAPGF